MQIIEIMFFEYRSLDILLHITINGSQFKNETIRNEMI